MSHSCRGGTVKPLVLIASEPHVVADYVQRSYHLTEDQHPTDIIHPHTHGVNKTAPESINKVPPDSLNTIPFLDLCFAQSSPSLYSTYLLPPPPSPPLLTH
jgi:hypothetical protein